MTYRERAAVAARHLEAAGFDAETAQIDASVLARTLLGWDQARWLSSGDRVADQDFTERFDRAIERRSRHEPVAYIVGEREFYGRSFLVTPAVLIPRPDTETLVAAALGCLDALTSRSPTAVDVGTGSGCVAVTLAAERPALRLAATDISSDALDVARQNASRHGVAARVDFRHGAFLAGLSDPVDLIVSNPPYVRDAERATLAPDVVAYEPGQALFAGPEGLDVIGKLVKVAADQLTAEGRLAVEIGWDQADTVTTLVHATGRLRVLAIEPDIEGRPRVVVAGRL